MMSRPRPDIDVELGALFDTPAPEVTHVQAGGLARVFIEGVGAVVPLGGERDRNFRVVDAQGRAFVLKVLHFAEDPLVSDFHLQALLHVARSDPGAPVPRAIAALDGSGHEYLWRVPGLPDRRVHLLGYLPGSPLNTVGRSDAQRGSVGRTLARLDAAMADYEHPAQHTRLLWDVQHVLGVRPMLVSIDEPEARRLAELALDRFEARVAPRLPGLRHQVIHNDFNPYNLLVDPARIDEVTGVIDFGDMVHASLVQDVATAAAYFVSLDGETMAGPAALVRGFQSITPLTDTELALLPDLMAARLALAVAVSSWRAAAHPDNAPYILKNRPIAVAGLARLAALAEGEGADLLTQTRRT